MKKLLFLTLFLAVALTACKKTPQPSFSYSLDEEKRGVVKFNNSSEDAEEFLWNFGDGESSDEENPSHLYLENGTYKVSLTAKSKKENTVITQEVVVDNLPHISFDADGSLGGSHHATNANIYTDNSGSDLYYVEGLINKDGDYYYIQFSIPQNPLLNVEYTNDEEKYQIEIFKRPSGQDGAYYWAGQDGWGDTYGTKYGVKVTAKSDKYIEGTFTAKLTDEWASGNYINVANGKFIAEILK